MFLEKEAPYFVVLIMGALGWLVTFVSQQYLAAPTLEISETQESVDAKTDVGEIYFSNVSKTLAISIHQIDFDGNAGFVLKTYGACGEFINVAPHKIAEGSLPFEPAGEDSSKCKLPIAMMGLTLAPGATFGVRMRWDHARNVSPYVVSASAVEFQEENTKNRQLARVVSSYSLDAFIARYMTAILLWSGLAGLIVVLAISILNYSTQSRKEHKDNDAV